MTINFPKFPNDRRDKNRPIDPNRAVILPLNVPSVDNTLPTGDNPAHNRSHHDMLTQTDQLQSETDSLTEAQRNLLKKHLKHQTAPTKNTNSLPLMPILLGLILLASGGVMGYMYQAYTQPPIPNLMPAHTTPTATPVTPPVATTPVSGVAGNTMPITASPASAVPTPAITVVSNPAIPPAAPLPSPINTDGNPNSPNNNNNGNNHTTTNNATGSMTNPVATAKPAPTEATIPTNTKPIDALPSTSPEANITTPSKLTDSPTKNTKSYEDFIKSSENTVFIEPPNHK